MQRLGIPVPDLLRRVLLRSKRKVERRVDEAVGGRRCPLDRSRCAAMPDAMSLPVIRPATARSTGSGGSAGEEVEGRAGQPAGERIPARVRCAVAEAAGADPADEPLCRECRKAGRIVPATDVDHRVARADGGTDDRSNLQPLCHACHSRKTVRENGGRAVTR